MSKAFVPLVVIVALGASAPAFATATQAAAQPAPPAAQAAPNRTTIIRNIDGNFKAIDSNGDGTLSAAELGAAEGKVQQQRITQLRARFEADFAKLDTNKDGQLSKVEFLAAAPRAPSTAPNGAAIVTQLDRNKDGKISADEYKAPMLARFDALDVNKDGTISAAERQAAQARAPRRK